MLYLLLLASICKTQMQSVRLIPLCMLTYKEDNCVLLLSVIPTARVVEARAAGANVPTF